MALYRLVETQNKVAQNFIFVILDKFSCRPSFTTEVQKISVPLLIAMSHTFTKFHPNVARSTLDNGEEDMIGNDTYSDVTARYVQADGSYVHISATSASPAVS